MEIKCPLCGASVEHDLQVSEGPVCPGCKLKLTPPGPPPIPTAAPVPPPIARSSEKATDAEPLLPAPVAAPPKVSGLEDLAPPPLHLDVPVARSAKDPAVAFEPETVPSPSEPPAPKSVSDAPPQNDAPNPAPAEANSIEESNPIVESSEETVLIPTAEGDFVPVDDRFTRIRTGNEEVEVLNVSHDQRQTSRRIRSTIIYFVCIVVLAGFMIWLSNFL